MCVHLYKPDNFRLNNLEEGLSLEETNFSQQPLINFSPSFKERSREVSTDAIIAGFVLVPVLLRHHGAAFLCCLKDTT